MDLKRGVKAVESLETNASKLSELIPELADVKTTLNGLKKAETTSQQKLKSFEKTISKLEGQLTESLQLKLAEGLAELSSRTKDIYDNNLTEQSKIRSEIESVKEKLDEQSVASEKLKSQLEAISNHLQKIEQQNKDNKKTFWRFSAVLLMLLITILVSEWRQILPINFLGIF